MKKFSLAFALLYCLFAGNAQTNVFPTTGSAGIGTTSPTASALLEMVSTSKGLLIPRMSKNQRDNITSPATGLLIYQTNNTPGFYYYDGSGWTAVTPKAKGWSLTGNAGTSPATNYLGTSDGQPLLFKVNNIKAGYLTYDLTGNASYGTRALLNVTTGSQNIAIGTQALEATTSGNANVGVGVYALYANTNGYGNVALGNSSLFDNIGGSNNTAVGGLSLYQNTTGIQNTAVGFFALANTTGEGNTAVGSYAMQASTTGSYNTAVGYDAGVMPFSGLNVTNSSALGYAAYNTANNQVRIGNGDVTSIGGYANWTNISDGRFKKNIKADVKGLDFINKLRPVTYNLDITGINNKLCPGGQKDKNGNAIATSTKQKEATAAKEKIIYSGFIAQEVEKAAKEIGYDFSGVDAPKNENDLYGLRYAEFVVPLVKAVQELSAINNAKDEKMNQMQQEIDELKTLVNKIASGYHSENNTATNNISLDQNAPNPFNKSSVVSYQLPAKYAEASIIITNMEGKIMKQIKVSGTGKGSITLDASALQAGTYKYALYVDKKIISSKTMIVIK